ncbi:translation initiation factor IF-2 [Maridesulfovibrio bastinii]|uniref:translation initiation factor IF-2 n=1 Tax=Maridesulfovibrio bastinii TaxID=47157 RepID=UPI000417B632|nr:translation initiation factor IF-2 [Maridesulfovibrio bastinii]
MAAKIRVNDLASELGVSKKEIQQAVSDLEIETRGNGVDSADADKIRAALAGASREVVRREVQPGVIVRRRKGRKGSKPSDEEAAEPKEEIKEETPSETVQDKKPAQDKKEKPAPAKKEQAAKDKPAKKTKSAKKVEKPLVKVIDPAELAAEKAAKKAAEEAALKAEQAKKEAEAAPSAPEESKKDPETNKEKAAPEKSEKENTPPAEKAIDKEAEKESKTAKEDKKQSAPQKTAEKSSNKNEADTKKKKRKKKKEVEAPKVKIISRPDPEAVAAKEAAKETAGGKGGGRPQGTRRAPGGRPPRQDNKPRGGGRPFPDKSAAPKTATNTPGEPPKDGMSKKKKGKKDRRVVDFNNDYGKRNKEREMDFPDNRKGKRGKKGKNQNKPVVQPASKPIKAAKRKIKFDEAIRLSDMAHQMGLKAQELIKVLFGLGVMATINQSLDYDTALLLAAEFEYEIENVSYSEEDLLVPQASVDKPEDKKPRPPIVTIMGHVDHGKTSLLDAIRHSDITDGEAGGITQHIGAYHVSTERGEVVFLDTPGHEAFTTMRMRGAQVTDIVILVVAADDGVMDQTREAISHSKAAGVPIVVAVNKIDKEDANPDRVKRELAEFDLVPEDWGGDTIFVPVSAKQKTGLTELLEMVLLQAEVLELEANPDKPARGNIVEAKLDKGRGPVGTVLIQEGTIHQGDPFVCGLFHGRVRAMFNDRGKKIKSAGPAIPVEIQGFDGIPDAGDEFICVADDKVARRIAQERQLRHREKELAGKSKVTLESFLASKPDQETLNLNVIVKADVQGSLEAISEALGKMATEEIKVDIVHGGAGAITESDVLLASASDAIIIGFNVRPTMKVKEVAEREEVEIRFYDIIYKLTKEIKDAMSGMLSPDIKENYLGQAEVRQTFSVPKVGTVAGCMVVDGKLTRNSQVRLLREGVVIYTGLLSSLKRFKDDVKEVAKGYECGCGLEKYNDLKVGDIIEAFEEVEIARTLE